MISTSVSWVRCLSHFFSSRAPGECGSEKQEREKGKSFLTAPVESLDECIVCQKTAAGKKGGEEKTSDGIRKLVATMKRK